MNIPNNFLNPQPSRSQKRLSRIFELCEEHSVAGFSQPQLRVLNNGLKTLLITLDAQYGLRGFLTLNDRGKELIYFEKLKGLMMEYDLSFGDDANPHNINTTFGNSYSALEASYVPLGVPEGVPECDKSLFSDDDLLRLLSIDVWRVGATLGNGIEKLFARYRNENPNYRAVHDDWLVKLEGLANKISCVTDRLNGVDIQPALIYNNKLGRRSVDHYKVVCDNLGLSNRSAAVVLKFSATFGVEWHEKQYTVPLDNQPIIDLLNAELRDIVGGIERPENEEIQQGLDLLVIDARNKIEAISLPETRQMSLLDLAEWIELFVVLPNSKKDFIATWKSAFDGINNHVDAFQKWVAFSTNFYARLRGCLGTWK